MNSNGDTGCVKLLAILGGLAAIVSVIIGVLAWLTPFSPIGPSPFARQTETQKALVSQTVTATAIPSPIAKIAPQAIFLGQDGADFAVSGCAGGDLPLGRLGTTDNHISISNIENLDRLTEVDISMSSTSDLGRWEYPCTFPFWQIVVKKIHQDQLDLYFESNTRNPVSALFTIILRFSNGTTLSFEVRGSSGRCCS